MRLLLIAFALLASAEGAFARGKPISTFRSKEGEQVRAYQEEKNYGLDLIITKGADRNGKATSKKVRNAFGVTLTNPSVILLCSISNGHAFAESFQVLDIHTMKSTILSMDGPPLGDDLECLVGESEDYFVVLDDFPDAKTTYLFARDGSQRAVFKGEIKTSIEIDGRVHKFMKARRFGGFR